MPKPVIDYAKCSHSKTCIGICPMSVYEDDKENNKTVVKKPEACIGCRACEMNCPAKAIKVED